MDRVLDYLSSYTSSLDFKDLPPEVVHQAKRLWLDTLGCALGGYTGEPSKIARALASAVFSAQPATILGSGARTSVDLATFANGIMVRYLDYNDFYQGPTVKTGGHPTDTFVAALSPAELAHRDGKALILGAVLGWEVFTRLGDGILPAPGTARATFVDHTTYTAIAAACIASKMLGLSQDQTAHAIALATTANVTLGQTRYGTVPMWKGCAAANACRNGVFATLLASRGMTGPLEVFEGDRGLFQATGGSFELIPPFGGKGQPFQIMQSSIKHYPIGSVSQTAIECALAIRPKLLKIDDITAVNIQTFQQASAVMADSPEKWHPQTRETADHSMPYGVALALIYGTVAVQHFSPEYLQSPELINLIQKIKVVASDECTRVYPEQRLNIVEIVTSSGQRFSERLGYHRGHPKNPMTDEELEGKFRSQAQGLLSESQIEAALECLRNLEQVNEVGKLIEPLKV